MPIVPNFLERLLFLRLNVAPGPFLDLSQAGVSRVVSASLQLGVFDALHGEPKTVAEIARRIGGDERGTTLVLEYLVTAGYAKKQDERYTMTPLASKWVDKDSPNTVAPFFTVFQKVMFPFWDAHLEESIIHGKPSMTVYDWMDQNPGTWNLAQDAFKAAARSTGVEIMQKAKLPSTAKRLLDVGGGHGLYSVQFCRKYPGMTATILDTQQPLTSARETIATENMGDRISVREGDYRRDDLGTGNDVVLLFNIIHGNSPEENIELFKKVAAALNPLGQVIILEQIAGGISGKATKGIVQFLGLTFFAALGAQTYEYDDVVKWLSTAGFSNPRRISLRRAPGISLVLAAKPN